MAEQHSARDGFEGTRSFRLIYLYERHSQHVHTIHVYEFDITHGIVFIILMMVSRACVHIVLALSNITNTNTLGGRNGTRKKKNTYSYSHFCGIRATPLRTMRGTMFVGPSLYRIRTHVYKSSFVCASMCDTSGMPELSDDGLKCTHNECRAVAYRKGRSVAGNMSECILCCECICTTFNITLRALRESTTGIENGEFSHPN